MINHLSGKSHEKKLLFVQNQTIAEQHSMCLNINKIFATRGSTVWTLEESKDGSSTR